jgi:hypothetical protein
VQAWTQPINELAVQAWTQPINVLALEAWTQLINELAVQVWTQPISGLAVQAWTQLINELAVQVWTQPISALAVLAWTQPMGPVKARPPAKEERMRGIACAGQLSSGAEIRATGREYTRDAAARPQGKERGGTPLWGIDPAHWTAQRDGVQLAWSSGVEMCLAANEWLTMPCTQVHPVLIVSCRPPAEYLGGEPKAHVMLQGAVTSRLASSTPSIWALRRQKAGLLCEVHPVLIVSCRPPAEYLGGEPKAHALLQGAVTSRLASNTPSIWAL